MADGGISFEKIPFAAEDIIHAGEARRNHGRGRRAVPRRHSGEIESFLHMLGISDAAAHPRSLLRAIREKILRLQFIESQECSGRGSCAECAPKAVRAAGGAGKLFRTESVV